MAQVTKHLILETFHFDYNYKLNILLNKRYLGKTKLYTLINVPISLRWVC
jgi:hypothetical protein